MDSKQFKVWCENNGLKVAHVRKNRQGRLVAYLAAPYGNGRAIEATLSRCATCVVLSREGREVGEMEASK